MASVTTANAGQYDDSHKLAARARLNRDYVVAETPWFEWVARHLPLKAGDHVLDVGCGPGWFWSEARRGLPERLAPTLCDRSPGMVAEAVARCRNLSFAPVEGVEASADALPFADASFDAVLAMHMLYHLPDPAAAIAELARVLKPGGFLAVTTNGAGNTTRLHELARTVGGSGQDPAAAIFGFDAAERLMGATFGKVEKWTHPARLRLTDPEDVFLALTSFPPGENADTAQRAALRDAIAQAFRDGGGVLETQKETGLFVSRVRSGARRA